MANRSNINFNSIKVQLEPYGEQIRNRFGLFQFHKGTIRTAFSLKAQGAQQLFQFHKGTIRTPRNARKYTPSSEFQFHKGTIRTW